MANELLTIDIDSGALLAALQRVGVSIEGRLKLIARGTANRVAMEAKARVARATGETLEGIVVEESQDGAGYVVVSRNRRMPNLPIWIERGTKAGKPGSHTQAPRPFFEPAAQLEAGPHAQRVYAAVVHGEVVYSQHQSTPR